jgi:hypothetical protein
MEDDKQDDATGEDTKDTLTKGSDPEATSSDDNKKAGKAGNGADTGPAVAEAEMKRAEPDASHKTSSQGAAWGEPLVKADAKWTKFEIWLCTVVILLEVFALTWWVALKGLSTGPDGAKAGVLFRGIVGATALGMLGFWGLKKQGETARRIAAIAGVLIGFVLARRWANVGVEWSSNLLNWYQQASTLTLFGGLRGVGTRLTLLLALIGGSLATAAGHHITIDLVTRFLKPKVRKPVTLIGWVGAAIICFTASWGYLDHIAIENFEAKNDATVGQKMSAVAHGLSEGWFSLRKQVALDFKSLPHMLKGEPYQDWLTGKEWNAWLDDAGFVERYGKEKIDPLRIGDEDKRSPMIVIPDKGEPRGALTHAANLVFPIGLFVIAIRFLLLTLLALSGHKKIEAEPHVDLGLRKPEEEGAKGAAQ